MKGPIDLKSAKTKKLLLRINIRISVFALIIVFSITSLSAQAILFDFDNAPLYSSLPINQTQGGITARLSATGQGYSIQEANVLGFVPKGFSGRVIYPNSINLSDLLIRFDQMITDFSIMYACQELGCDDAATMRVTAYSKGNWVGTKTKTAKFPGTWPVDTLGCSFSVGFDSVVVHYDSRPPTCQDYGVIFMADQMRVTPYNSSGISNLKIMGGGLLNPNPASVYTTLTFELYQSGNTKLSIYDSEGKFITNIFDGPLVAGVHHITWNINTGETDHGLYFLVLTGNFFSRIYKLVISG